MAYSFKYKHQLHIPISSTSFEPHMNFRKYLIHMKKNIKIFFHFPVDQYHEKLFPSYSLLEKKLLAKLHATYFHADIHQ